MTGSVHDYAVNLALVVSHKPDPWVILSDCTRPLPFKDKKAPCLLVDTGAVFRARRILLELPAEWDTLRVNEFVARFNIQLSKSFTTWPTRTQGEDDE
jgi:hypothetical protein